MFTLVHLNTYTLIQVSGSDAQSFLQGQLTCDVRALQSTGLSLGAYCNLKGRVMVLFKLFVKDNVYYLQCPTELALQAIEKFQRHALFSQVHIQNQSPAWSAIGLIGDIALLQSQYDTLFQNLIVVATPNNTESQWECIGPSYLIATLWDTLIQAPDVMVKTLEYWKLLDIRKGIPEIYLNTSERFLAHHLNLPALNAVCFSKGCYHGQEIIARMQYRSTIKKQLVHRVGELHSAETQDADNVVMSSINDNGIVESLVIQPC